MTRERTRTKRLCANAVSTGTHLYTLHLQEGGHLESLLPDLQLAVQLHAEEQVLPALRLDAEAVFPLVQEVVVLEQTAQQPGPIRYRRPASSLRLKGGVCSEFMT